MEDGIPIFKPDSLRYVAIKIGNYSGDIRRGLMITRRAVELTRDNYVKEVKAKKRSKNQLLPVTIDSVISSFEELYSSKTVRVLQ